ncbi:Hypothetical protein GbCGDNIH9_8214 [Granulibacter bethesdensis]|uniref:Uncharacterized protein n=1 Tax=Granulibacter bethesdensis TaxID=364410 RepID=A0AAC9P886_9PROT|nr:Hypothetical protein GbCGDNIH9_8214 [Granulibacter bethesdensis]APH61891.1 Hypothetical protein GbCGDNIH8_8489 [Granulibacter bethesdensis]
MVSGWISLENSGCITIRLPKLKPCQNNRKLATKQALPLFFHSPFHTG